MYVFSVQIYIYTLRAKSESEEEEERGAKTFLKTKIKKQTLTDIYKTLYFHEMSKCDIGYT